MPLNIVATEAPQEVPGLVEAYLAPSVSPLPIAAADLPPAGAAAPPVVPVPIVTPDIPPVTAGLKLASFVLWIAIVSIISLILYLVLMDLMVARNVLDAYHEVPNANPIGSEFYTLDRLERLSADLKAAQDQPSKSISAVSLQNAESMIEMLSQLPSITNTEKTQLKDCIPLPASEDASRSQKLDRCLAIIKSIKLTALESAAGATNLQVAGESANKINEQRQSFHTFWLQAAQLILLNLLLPILTALLGYIFGTHQTQRAA